MNEPEVEKLCHQGRVFVRSNKLSEAAAVFRAAVEKDPDCCDAHEGLATCAYMSGDYSAAIEQYSQLTLLKPMESRFFTNLGAIHNRLGEHLKACDYLRKAIQRNKRCAESFYNLGIAQRKLKQNAMAVSAYKEAIKIDPTMAEAHQNLGNVYVEMGNLKMAIDCFKKALEIKPDFQKARTGLEAAEEKLNQAKMRNNPFGRLAEMKSTVSSVVVVTSREMNEEERYEDRKFVKQAADDIEHISRDCVEHLRTKLIPAILEVERAMAHGVDELYLLDEASNVFREATSNWHMMRATLKCRLEELRDHEETVCAMGDSET